MTFPACLPPRPLQRSRADPQWLFGTHPKKETGGSRTCAAAHTGTALAWGTCRHPSGAGPLSRGGAFLSKSSMDRAPFAKGDISLQEPAMPEQQQHGQRTHSCNAQGEGAVIPMTWLRSCPGQHLNSAPRNLISSLGQIKGITLNSRQRMYRIPPQPAFPPLELEGCHLSLPSLLFNEETWPTWCLLVQSLLAPHHMKTLAEPETWGGGGAGTTGVNLRHRLYWVGVSGA